MKKHITTRIVLAILAGVMALGCFAGCSGKGKNNGTTTVAPDTSSPDTTPTEPAYELPIADFENEIITILLPYGKNWQFLYESTSNSDRLNMSLYNRDKKVEEVLNCTIEYNYTETQGLSNADAAAKFDTLLTQEQLDQSGAYDIVYHEAWYALDFKGYFCNLYGSDLAPVVNLEQPFYFDEWNEVATINGILVSTMSYGSMEMMSAATVTMFNHDWWKKLFEGNIYDYVYDGDWTIELMETMAKEANVDVRENGLDVTEGDKFGIGYMTASLGMFYTMGGKFFTKNANGDLTYDFLSDPNIGIFEKLYDLLVGNNDCVYVPNYSDAAPVYNAEQILFLMSYFDGARAIKREGGDNAVSFGFLPNPKLNATDEYKSTLVSSSMFSIPKTASDIVKSGIFLNAYSYYSYEKVRPEYFDSTMKFQVSKDQDSAYVVDLCMENLTIDFAKIYNDSLLYCGQKYWNLIVAEKRDEYVSTYLGIVKQLDESLNTLLSDFKTNNS